MGITKEGQGKHQFAAAAKLTAAEERAVKCFAALRKAERSFSEGMQFGQAMIELRDEIKADRARNFMERLGELGITYAKARYWIAVVEGKEINRGSAEKPAPTPTPECGIAADWNDTTDKFEKLSGVIADLYRSQPDGSEGLIETLRDLAHELGYELVKREGGNA